MIENSLNSLLEFINNPFVIVGITAFFVLFFIATIYYQVDTRFGTRGKRPWLIDKVFPVLKD